MTRFGPVGDGAVNGRQPLSGVRVLDLTEWVAGPNCTKLLGDYGADVVKVERPGGDPARRMGAREPDTAGADGCVFLHLGTNKRSLVVDIAQPEGADLVRRLAVTADIVVDSAKPDSLTAAGLDAESLLAANPRAVITSVTPFGQTGPYRDWDMTEIVAFAMGGMCVSGVAEREPVKLIGNIVLMQSGATACVATLGALFHARAQGIGQHVDVATFETQNGSLDRRRYYLLSYQYSGTVAERAASVGAGRAAAGGRFECADGRQITTGRIWPDHVARMVQVIDSPALHELWASEGETVMTTHAAELNEWIATWAVGRDSRSAMREAQAGGWPVVVVNDPLLLLDDDHLRARGFWVTAAHPVAGELPYAGAPWRVAGGGWALRAPAPLLGQHTEEVLRDELALAPAEIEQLRASGVVA